MSDAIDDGSKLRRVLIREPSRPSVRQLLQTVLPSPRAAEIENKFLLHGTLQGVTT